MIVTTPQDIALLDAQKAIEMFRKVKVPVLGVVENMALYTCGQCGHREHIFGSGGGERIAQDYSVPLLGSLPLSKSIREQTDAGLPPVVAEPDGDVAALYRAIARAVIAQVAMHAEKATAFPDIIVEDD